MYSSIHDAAKTQLRQQIAELVQRSPGWSDCIDQTRVQEVGIFLSSIAHTHPIDFETQSKGGRGEVYRLAQQNPTVRFTGIKNLFTLLSPEHNFNQLHPNYKILDVLGGDGVIARALDHCVLHASRPNVLTSDLSEDMVRAAQNYGLAAIRQPAQKLLLKDKCLDAVLIAYGAHHIPQDQRLQACQEAFRVLKPGGKFVFHDFERESPVARWFSEVVDKYTLAGHDYVHFTAGEIYQYLDDAGFEKITVQHVYDPFIFSGESLEQVQQLLAEYLQNMYGLVKSSDGQRPSWREVYQLAERIFQYDYASMNLGLSTGSPQIQVAHQHDRYTIEMPRVSLVGSAQKVLL